MNCLQVRDFIDDYYENNSADTPIPFSRTDIREHLDQCVACRTYLEQVTLPLVHAANVMPPEPSPELKSRILNSLKPERSGLLWLSSVAALAICCLFFIAGYRFGQFRNGLENPAPMSIDHTDGAVCRFYSELSANPSGYLTPVKDIEPREFAFPDQSSLWFPSQLVSHGRYQLDTRHILLNDAEACMAFVSPLGDSLMLHLRRTTGSQAPDQTYVVRQDPERVMAYSVTWVRDGWICTISGRLPPDYLLGLARELSITT